MIVVGYYGFKFDIYVSVHPSVVHPSIFSFPYNNLSKYQWIFTKLGLCIYIVKIWFWIANGQILANFDSYLPTTSIFLFPDNNLSKYQCFFTKLGMYIDIVELWFEIANGIL